MPKLLGHEIPSCEDVHVLRTEIEALEKKIKYHHYTLAALIGAVLAIAIFK